MMSETARRGPRGLLVLLVTAVLAAAVGFGAAQLWPSPPGDTSAEAGFARDMSTHHGQAVEIAMLGYSKATLPELRTIGYDIALTQQAQIGTMGAWLKEWHLQPTGSQPKMAWMPEGTRALKDGLMPGMATPAELSQLREASGTAFDVLFCQLMLRHHLGGIHMVDGVVKLGHDDEVAQLAGTMKAGQQKEITIFRGILTQLGAKPLPA